MPILIGLVMSEMMIFIIGFEKQLHPEWQLPSSVSWMVDHYGLIMLGVLVMTVIISILYAVSTTKGDPEFIKFQQDNSGM